MGKRYGKGLASGFVGSGSGSGSGSQGGEGEGCVSMSG